MTYRLPVLPVQPSSEPFVPATRASVYISTVHLIITRIEERVADYP